MLNTSLLLLISLFLASCIPKSSRSSIVDDSKIKAPEAKPTFPSGGNDPGAKMGYSLPTSTECNYYRNLWGVDDEYFCDQWHLINRGVKVNKIPNSGNYADSGLAGADIKIESARKNYSGEGVRIYVTDDGLFSQHPDIKANYLSGFNNCTKENNGNPATPSDNHGTMVSGIIAAVAGNGIGVSGVAPQAKLFMNNYLSCQTDQADLVQAIKADKSFNIWSGSFGIRACAGFLPRSQQQTIYDAYSYGANNNILYFKANGNDNQPINCEGVGNNDPANSHYAVASIAALDNSGKITSYSSRGANLSLSAFAGFGGSSNVPGIVTISQNNSYTSSMNGTSAATPITAGSAALIIDALPGLKWYEYQTLMMRTASIIDEPTAEASPLNGINYATYLVNDAGYRHSYSYGLGVVDVDAAIELGKTSSITLPELKKYSEKFGSIPTSENSATSFAAGQCADKKVVVNSSLQIFSIEASFNITIGAIENLMLFIITPKGRVGQLMRTSGLPGSNLTHDQYFKSMQGFAMDTQGTWTFRGCGKSSGVFNNAKLNFYGFEGSPIPIRK